MSASECPAVSVVVPVYNVEQYLVECLDSLLAQTMEDWEAICIDDGSQDGSGAILDEYAARDSRFRVVHKFAHEGLQEGVDGGREVLFVCRKGIGAEPPRSATDEGADVPGGMDGFFEGFKRAVQGEGDAGQGVLLSTLPFRRYNG